MPATRLYIRKWLKRLCFSLIILFVLGFAGDIWLHSALGDAGGYNRMGFRGPADHSPSSFNVGCFGGSAVYGVGVKEGETWPYYLQEELRKLDPTLRTYNFGGLNQGLSGVNYDLKAFEDYNCDLILIELEFPVDRTTLTPADRFRGDGWFHRFFGYKWILFDWATGSLPPTDPSALAPDSSRLNDIAWRINRSDEAPPNSELLENYWTQLDHIFQWSVDRLKQVVVLVPPGLEDWWWLNRLQAQTEQNFPSVRWVGSYYSDHIDPTNPAHSPDGLHLTAEGNRILAEKLGEWLRYSMPALGKNKDDSQ